MDVYVVTTHKSAEPTAGKTRSGQHLATHINMQNLPAAAEAARPVNLNYSDAVPSRVVFRSAVLLKIALASVWQAELNGPRSQLPETVRAA